MSVQPSLNARWYTPFENNVPTDTLTDLNPRQREAVETIDGPLLIVAGPGSGKTRVITHRIAHLVAERGVRPYRIASVTFTNKAAREMRGRLESLMGRDAHELMAGTFHSFCGRVLRRDGDHIGLDRNFVIYDDTDQIGLIGRAMEEIDVDPKRFKPRAVLSAISSAKSRLQGVDGFRAGVESYFDEVAHRVYERYEDFLARAGAVDFDDLLMKTYLLLRDFPDVADRYSNRYLHFMIDEFQDTNSAQYAIARQVSAVHRNLCVVGDPDQSIYSWRNADIGNILSFKKDYPEAKVVPLEENYRSTQTILDAARSVIAANTQRVKMELRTHKGPGVPICVFEAYNEQDEAQFVVREITTLTGGGNGSGRYGLSGIAVMYRVNAQSRALEEECLRQGVPYQVVGGLKFYLRQEIKDLTAYLRLTANPHDDVSLARVINTPSRRIGRRTLEELTHLADRSGVSMYDAIESLQSPETWEKTDLTSRAIRALIGFKELVDDLADEVDVLSLPELISLTFRRSGYEQHLQEDDEHGEERLENVQEYIASARDFEDIGGRDALAEFLEHISLVSDVDELEEGQSNRVTLITLHQAKGLEFPVVFMVGMEEGLLPHVRSMDDPSEVEEERRLCYVGITRAEERVYLLRAFRRGLWGRSEPTLPSRFLSDVPGDLIVTPSRATLSRAPSPTLDSLHVRRRAARLDPTTEDGDGAESIGTGDKVRHSLFGDGIVTSSKPTPNDVELVVAFKDGHGVKRLLQSFAPLEKLQ